LLVGLKVQNPVKNDYKAMGDSFLMSTIALGKRNYFIKFDRKIFI
jgi:hypothetical protein